MLKFVIFIHRAVFAMVLVLLCSSAALAAVEYVQTEGKGSGQNRNDAINAALAEAVAKVNGLSLTSEDVSALKVQLSSVEAQTKDVSIRADSATIEEARVKQISTATRGVVQSYDVVSETPSTINAGWVDIVVNATVSRYKMSAQTQRQRIAVMPFRVQRGADMVLQKFAQLTAQGVTNYLSQTRRFAVLDRDFTQEKYAEFNLLQQADVPAVEKARIGNTLGADYILVGAVDLLAGNRSEEKVAYVNELQVTYRINARVSWRIIEVATGMVALAHTVDEKQTHKLNASSNEMPGLPALADTIAKAIGERTMDTIYPMMAVAFGDGSITIGQGGDTLKAGQRFNLMRYGEILRDPYTKEPVGRQETQMAVVEITNVLPKTAQAKIVEGAVTPEQFKPKTFILRAIQGQNASAKPAPKKTMKPKW